MLFIGCLLVKLIFMHSVQDQNADRIKSCGKNNFGGQVNPKVFVI